MDVLSPRLPVAAPGSPPDHHRISQTAGLRRTARSGAGGGRRREWPRVLWLALALLACAVTASEKPLSAYQYRHWSSAEGLPHNTVTAIVETPNGFLWFGTPHGLVRFNGAQMQDVPQLRGGGLDLGINALWVAEDGALWMATRSEGVIRRQLHEPEQRWSIDAGLPGREVHGIASDARGRPVVIAERSVMRLVDERFVAIEGLPSRTYRGIDRDREGRLWLSARDRVLHRVDADGAVRAIELPAPATGPLRVVGATLWVATRNGLLAVDEDGGMRQLEEGDGLASTLIEALYGDRSGALWIAHRGRGLQRLRGGRFERFGPSEGLPSGYLRSLYEDRHGALWVGGELGVGRVYDAPVVLFDDHAGLASSAVRSVLTEPDGSVWAGSDSGGLARIRGYAVERFGRDQGLLDDNVSSLARDAEGGLWVALFDAGLQRLHDGRWQTWQERDGLPSARIQALLAEPDGRLWLGSEDRGLAVREDGRFRRLLADGELADTDVRSLLRRKDGRLAVGTAGNGLVLLDADLGHRVLDARHGLRGNAVLALHEDARQRLWIGTDEGLAVLEGATLRHLDEALHRAVYFIADHSDGGLWLAGSHGVAHLPRIAIEQITGDRRVVSPMRYLGPGDGLVDLLLIGGNQPAGAVAADGRLWLPTARGLAVIDPAQLPARPSLPRLQIDSLRVSGRAVDFDRLPLAFSAEQKQIEIGVGSVHSLGMGRLQLQSRLDGLEADWRPPSEEAHVLYAALAPGSYRFRVRGLVDPGQGWFTEEATLDFSIARHWYQQPAAWAALSLIIILVPLLLFRWRQHRLLLERSQLAAEVAARTRDLSQTLVQARQATEVKTRFLASISHELRTPLTAILGFSEQMLGAAPEPLLAPLRRIHRAARLQLGLIDDILDASRLENGSMAVELQPVAPLALLRDTLALVEPSAEDKQLQLRLYPHWPLPAEVHADPLRLRQILLNLVGNAIKFSRQGEVRIDLAADRQAGRWWFEVIDHGVGIDPAQQARLFEAFVQADASTSRRFGGSGLGLYISRTLAERMGGQIELQSRPGAGTQVRASFPLVQPLHWLDVEGATGDEDAVLPGSPPPPRLRGEVLIADDADDVAELLQGMIAATGARAQRACDGGEALAMAEDGRFDLILLDLRMPVLDGLGVAERLRRRGLDTPILLLTADLLDPAVGKSPPPGCQALLPKPIDRGRLYDLLAAFLPLGEEAVDPDSAADEGLQDLETRLAHRFAARLQGEAEALRQALQAGDRQAAIALLHRLKGSAPMFGRQDIGALAARLEQALRAAEPLPEDALQALHAQLDPATQAHP